MNRVLEDGMEWDGWRDGWWLEMVMLVVVTAAAAAAFRTG